MNKNQKSWFFDVNVSNASQIRNAFKAYFCSTGAVEQQWERALNNNF